MFIVGYPEDPRSFVRYYFDRTLRMWDYERNRFAAMPIRYPNEAYVLIGDCHD